MTHRLSRRSLDRMEKLHPDLKKVVVRASEILNPGELDFSVGECARSRERQLMLVRNGASQTMKSRHLVHDGICHAVDLIALLEGDVSWDWPLYERLAWAMKRAAEELGVDMEWGGDWKTLKDGPHFQLSWSAYPIEAWR